MENNEKNERMENLALAMVVAMRMEQDRTKQRKKNIGKMELYSHAAEIFNVAARTVRSIVSKHPEFLKLKKREALLELRKRDDYLLAIAMIDKLKAYYIKHKEDEKDSDLNTIL